VWKKKQPLSVIFRLNEPLHSKKEPPPSKKNSYTQKKEGEKKTRPPDDAIWTQRALTLKRRALLKVCRASEKTCFEELSCKGSSLSVHDPTL